MRGLDDQARQRVGRARRQKTDDARGLREFRQRHRGGDGGARRLGGEGEPDASSLLLLLRDRLAIPALRRRPQLGAVGVASPCAGMVDGLPRRHVDLSTEARPVIASRRQDLDATDAVLLLGEPELDALRMRPGPKEGKSVALGLSDHLDPVKNACGIQALVLPIRLLALQRQDQALRLRHGCLLNLHRQGPRVQRQRDVGGARGHGAGRHAHFAVLQVGSEAPRRVGVTSGRRISVGRPHVQGVTEGHGS
mmetsp:Transcript_51709/g.138398  ORF Transcript_51709/g.138398 Transcript_51709/m.138398 type:complete len:251 (-) Transcript_51709:662-1414(-)